MFIYRNIISNSFLVKLLNNSFYQFRCCKSLTGDKLTKLDSNALQSRIIKYLQEANSPVKQIKDDISINKYVKKELRVLDNNDLAKFISYLADPNENVTIEKYRYSLNNLDRECCKRLQNLSTGDILKYLNNFVLVIPHVITRLNFYNRAIEKLYNNIDTLTKNELLQLCFFTALLKNTNESKNILKSCLMKLKQNHLNTLTLNDIIIICNSSFKSSLKIDRKLLEKTLKILYNDLSILNDPPIFVTIVKTLRLNKYYDDEILVTISHTIFFNKSIQHYNFTAVTHVLALYADALHFDEKLINLFVETCQNQLRNSKTLTTKNEHLSKQMRLKDLSRLLWSLSYIGYKLEKTFIESSVIPLIREFLSISGCKNEIEQYVNILLSLWVMDYFAFEILPEIISDKTISLLHKKKKQRYSARLNLLLTCIQLEFPNEFNKLNVNITEPMTFNLNAQLNNRPYLSFIHKSLNNICEPFNIKKIKIESTIPHLNILGITGCDENDEPIIYIDLVDDLVSARGIYSKSLNPHGLMNLKIRLVKLYNKKILILFKDQVTDLTQSEFEIFLKTKLTRIFAIR